jgi:Uma2 family endonuclease
MSVTLTKWTVEQYHQMIEAGVLDDLRVELLNGEIVEMPSEGLGHAQGSTDTADLLREKLQGRALVRDAKPITLPEQVSEPEPDLAVVAPLRELYRTEHHPYPDNIFLLIEYAYASLAKDKELKRLLYAQAAIIEYWIVNLKNREVIVHRDPVDGDYRSIQILTSGSITLLAFPDVTMDVMTLLDG